MPDYGHQYPSANKELIAQLQLRRHPEGGYFRETDRQDIEIPSPFADNRLRPLATSIYYLLTFDERAGRIHMNKSVTYHVLHQGRAEYTLITPGEDGAPPEITKRVMGTNMSVGEQRLLIVEGGVWKMSAIPEEDIQAAQTVEEKEHTGCLITEVVLPGFSWEDHDFLTSEGIRDMFHGVTGGEEKIKEFSPFLKDIGC